MDRRGTNSPIKKRENWGYNREDFLNNVQKGLKKHGNSN